MTQTLRKKVFCITMTVLCLLVLLVNGIARLTMLRACGQLTESILQVMAENADGVQGVGEFRLEKGPLIGTLTLNKEQLRTTVNMEVYGMEIAADGTLRSCIDAQGTHIRQEGLEELAGQLSERPTGGGRIGNMQYYQVKKAYGTYAAVTDCKQGIGQLVTQHLDQIMLLVAVPGLLVLVLVSMLLSKLLLRPMGQALEKQKQFVSDAGHELKTPLAAINVNAAVLAAELGENRYLDCIQSEAKRMEGLIRQMLDVACMERQTAGEPKQLFSLSETVYQATLPFESIAFEQGIQYTCDIQENCQYTGDPARIRQLLAILLDNAFKYGEPGGTVKVTLRKEGRRFVLEVYNTGRGISKQELPHIFERFYRCDKARPGNGSYGLGLAIAQAVVQGCGGRLTAESEPGAWARFRATL